MEVTATPRTTLARSGAVMAIAQLGVGVVCLFAAGDVGPAATADAFMRFGLFALCAAAGMLLLALSNLVGPAELRTALAAGAMLGLAAALVFWVLAVARDVGTTWLWLGAPLWLINSWLAVGTWRTRSLSGP
jgi:hypothetical protein